MLLSDVVARRFTVDLRIELPPGAKVTSSLEAAAHQFEEGDVLH